MAGDNGWRRDDGVVMATMFVIDKVGEELEVEGEIGVPVMETLRDLENGVEAICGGMCSCATCHCFIDDDWFARLPEREPEELDLLEELESFDPERSRLTCQIEFAEDLDGLTLTIAPDE